MTSLCKVDVTLPGFEEFDRLKKHQLGSRSNRPPPKFGLLQAKSADQ
jgi:hypothetical protein